MPSNHKVLVVGTTADYIDWIRRTRPREALFLTDPLVPNPMAAGRYYSVDIYRLMCAVMLGILTYDGNLLIITKRKTKAFRQK